MRRSIGTFVATALAGLLLVSPTQAALILTLSDGDTTYTTTDLDTDGSVLFVGSIGDWVLNITVGVANPMTGDGNTSTLDLNSLNVTGISSASGGTLRISLTDTDNNVPLGDTNYMVEFGGKTGGSISFESYVDSSNTAFGTETLLYSTGGLGGAFSGSGSGSVNLTGPYSITTVATIVHKNRFSVTGFTNGVTIPEPGSLALIGIGLLALAFGARRSDPRNQVSA